MKKQLNQVKEFHRVFGASIEESPTMPDRGIQRLREDLIREELEEFKDANKDDNIVEVADALTDLLYVVYGAAICYGLTDYLEDCFEEVHSSNMSKTDEDGNAIFRDDGKILKGANYRRPNLKSIVVED